jgi:RNA polymerase sigma-70 factor (ECF subfamily)
MIEAITTPDLIVRAQQGDTVVIAGLYERHRQQVFRFLYYRLGDAEAAEDLTSEVFVRMLRGLNSYRPGNVPFRAWLFQIARNLAIDYYRAQRIRRHDPLDEALPASGPRVEQAAAQRAAWQHLAAALAQLGDDQRDVILLRFISGLPIAETARALHKSEDAVKGLQRRALDALRQHLADKEVFDDGNG